MKVTGKGSSPMQNVESGKTGKAGATDGGKKSESKALGFDQISSSKVDISTRAQDIRKAKELATPKGDIDEAKVARLQKLIDEGNYNVDAAAVADRLVDEHLEMPN